MIQKIIRLSDFPLLDKLLTKGKTILAHNKKNYYAELDQIKGDQITHIEEDEANPANGERMNVIKLRFDNNLNKYFVVYNGEDGDQGNKGEKGEKGLKGNSFNKNEVLRIADDALVIANDDITDDANAVWSAYRGKLMGEFLRSVAEKIITDEEYQLLFNEEFDENGRPNDIHQVFIDMEFVTKNNNQATALVHTDTKEYKTYVKYWTYEGETAITYYTKVDNEYVEASNFDLWNDYYLNPDNNETYYTRQLVITEMNEITGEIISSEYQYTALDKPIWIDLEFTTNNEDQTSNILNAVTGTDDPEDIPIDVPEDEIVVRHRPITSIYIDGHGSTSEDALQIPINTIFTKAINIEPTDYLNSPICIEYDETKINVFEDGRIMALENNCNTVIKIYSQENPSIYANVYVNVITYVDAIQFNTSVIKAFEGHSVTIDYTVIPESASNKSITWSSSNSDVASVDQNGTITLHQAGKTATIYASTNDGSGVISRIDVIVDIAVEDILIDNAKTNTDEEGHIESYDYEVLVGIPTTINATVIPDNASTKQLEWTSENANISVGVADNGVNGQVYLMNKDNCVVMVKSTDGTEITKQINIIGKIPVSNITLDTHSATIDKGDTLQLTYTITNNADNDNVIWESSNTNIATVDQTGLITAVTGGNAIITVRAADGSGVYDTCDITTVVLITDIRFNQKNIELHVGNTYAFVKDDNYTIEPYNANVTQLNWYTSNESIATITNSGIITAIKEGKVKVYAAATDNSGVIVSADINVTVPTSELLLSDYAITLNVDQTHILVATVYPDNTSLQNVQYYSENENVAQVDANGNITAIGSGETSIIVSTLDGTNLSQKCDVTVL